MSPPVDPNHWLHRLTAEQWLDAAAGELDQARVALKGRHQRKGVTSARRAAGMAINGLLSIHPQPAWGRSYMEHLLAVAQDEAVPQEVRAAARLVADAPSDAPMLVRIGGGGDESVAEAAVTIACWAESLVHQALAANAAAG